MKKPTYILWFKEIHKEDTARVGGKGANLGEMTQMGLPVPKGFALTAQAYFKYLEDNHYKPEIRRLLARIDYKDPQTLNIASQKIKKLIISGKIPDKLSQEIIFSYLELGGLFKQSLVAIRSSATAEDLPDASFAGQQRSFLNIRGESNVVEKVKECWASLFEPRAIFYRQEKGFDHFKVGLSAIIQEMVPAEISGVMFTADPVTNEKNRIVIEAIYGLGEYIVQGIVTPDRYVIAAKTYDILTRQVYRQTVQLIKVKNLTKETIVPKNLQSRRKLSDKQIKDLSKFGKQLHRHYFYPQDIEWTLYKGQFSIVQTRPVTTLRRCAHQGKPLIKELRKAILLGQPASPGIAAGPVKIIKTPKTINQINQGDILVTSMTTPDFVPAMKKVNAIVTDRGGQTSHAAIVSRELGVPCIVGTQKATIILKNKQIITVNGTKGEVFSGGLLIKPNPILPITKTEKKITNPNTPFKTATKIYVNLAEPEMASEISLKNVDGIGLLRAEFMMAQIGKHPKLYIRNKQQKAYVDKLAEMISQFCLAFSPRPVVYRTSDFKTTEYRNLVGGQAFEPKEENPFIGYRGAFRYVNDPAVFEMELEAIKKVRQKFNNLWLMIPFCRTPEELIKVKKIIGSLGLIRSPSFKLWLMVEIPANVIMLEDFINAGIDGISIGSNDLTMLILGIDRDNEILAPIFNEQNPAVLWALEKVIKTANKYRITSSVCGQAPSTHPDLVEKLIDWGITSVSVNPDAIERTRNFVYDVERKKIGRKIK